MVCDPTILLENKFWNDKIDVDLNSAVLVYTYSLPKSIISHIKKYAQVQGLKLVSIGLYQSWCDEHINCSALDFPAYLQSARLVITNTFHGTIFSILTKSNVVSVEKGNKLKELIESLNAQQIVLEKECTYENFSDMANQSIDYSDIYAHMEEIRTRSSRLLRNIIGSYCSGNNGEES